MAKSAKWYSMSAKRGVGEINIFSDIGFGYTVSDFTRELNALGDLTKLRVRINSPGGDVFQGFAIYNVLNRIRDKVEVVVEGIAASMASVVAMAGSKIIMPENAMMMIHDPIGGAFGGPEEMASFADALSKMRDQIAAAYVERTGLSEARVRDMMGVETWLSADEAVTLGFADQVEKPIKMAAQAGLDLSRFHNVPTSLGISQNEGTDMKDEIKRLCALFGKPDLADGFIADNKSIADVLTELEKQTQLPKQEAKKEEPKQQSSDDIRASLVAEMAEIKALCKLAGKSNLADKFIEDKKTVKEVIAELAKAPAGTDEKNQGELSPHHKPTNQGEGRSIPLDPVAIWDKYNRKAGKAA